LEIHTETELNTARSAAAAAAAAADYREHYNFKRAIRRSQSEFGISRIRGFSVGKRHVPI